MRARADAAAVAGATASPLQPADAARQARPRPDGGHPAAPGPRPSSGCPTVASIVLSFTNWNGIGSPRRDKFIGLQNYENLFTAYPFFWPALSHNIIWLVLLMFIATPIGMFLAVLLDREIRGTRIYQSVFYMPGRPVAGRRSGSSGS